MAPSAAPTARVSAARFYDPEGIAVDGTGTLYVADTRNWTIRRITPAGVVTTVAGLPGDPGHVDGVGVAARFLAPQGIAIDGAGNLYVAEGTVRLGLLTTIVSNTVRKITGDGGVTTVAGMPRVSGSGDGTGAAAQFSVSMGVAATGEGMLVYRRLGQQPRSDDYSRSRGDHLRGVDCPQYRERGWRRYLGALQRSL